MTKKIDVLDICALLALFVLLAFAASGCCGVFQPQQQTPAQISYDAEKMHVDTAFDVIEKEVEKSIETKKAAQITTESAHAIDTPRKDVPANNQPPETKHAASKTETQISAVPVVENSEPENIKDESSEEKSNFGDLVLQYRDWLFFLAYCAVSLLAAWYFKRTGKNSETLQQIETTVGQRLTFKHRALFRVLRFIYRRKAAKKQEQKEAGK